MKKRQKKSISNYSDAITSSRSSSFTISIQLVLRIEIRVASIEIRVVLRIEIQSVFNIEISFA